MKTLMTLTAAALIAGISGVSAQNAATPNQKVPPPSSINAGGYTGAAAKSGSESTPAAKGNVGTKMGKTAANVVGNMAFCTRPRSGPAQLNCEYATMAECQKIAQPGNKRCVSNPQFGTTGAGSGMNMKK